MWIFSSKHDGQELQTDLTLDWQVNGTVLSNHYTPQETDATELWQIWLERYGRRDHPELGAGWVPIAWYVRGATSATGHVFEPAPFAYTHTASSGQTFLDHFTWPEDEATRERLRWSGLPVEDKAWLPGQDDEGGFFQQATGWKPAPYQPLIHLPTLAQAAGLPN